jgi:probable rRNA maturation factor
MSIQNFSVNTTVSEYPIFPYLEIKEAIVGKKYVASLNFVGAKRAKSLNIAYRQKDYVPNVLSFPLDEATGEIFICLEVAKKEAKNFNLTSDGYVAFLFIHGLLHLKGHDHSDKMDVLEQKYVKKFGIV